jgi:hypothetical protein
MFLRPTMLALVLVVGIAAAASAQSSEYPFRRFRLRTAPQPWVSLDNSFRMKIASQRVPKSAFWRTLAAAERARERQFANLDRQLTLRNRAFDRVDRANRRQLELRFRAMDRLQDRLDRFKLDRPLRIKRHSRII